MKPLKADAGFVFSSDVDRVALVTDTCETLSEEYTFPLVAENVLSGSAPGQIIATNTCSTRTLDQVAARHCAKVCKGMTGETYTIDLMQEKEAVLCGDGSGGTALRSSGAAGFDGFGSMMQILELMARRETSLSALAGVLPRYHIVKRTIPCRSTHVYAAIRKLVKLFPDAEFSDLDGLRFDWADGWVHIRASRTEPSIRMILEWKSRAEAEEKAMNIISIVERVVGE
jgi:phosphomannomutase